MGVATVDSIMKGLLKGLPSHTPVAIVQNASLPAQRQAGCLLGQLVQTIKQHKFASPSVRMVGDVASGLAAITTEVSSEPLHAVAA